MHDLRDGTSVEVGCLHDMRQECELVFVASSCFRASWNRQLTARAKFQPVQTRKVLSRKERVVLRGLRRARVRHSKVEKSDLSRSPCHCQS